MALAGAIHAGGVDGLLRDKTHTTARPVIVERALVLTAQDPPETIALDRCPDTRGGRD
jgi:hypothetical protein